MKKVLLILLIATLLVVNVNAFEFDNVLKKVDNKEKLEIINSFGLGSKIVDIELIENTDYCLKNCYAIFNVKLYNNNILMTNFDFETDNKIKKQLINSISICEQKTKVVEVPIYNKICDGKNEAYKCRRVIESYKTQEQTYCDWKKYKGEVLPAGEYTVKLEGQKNINDNIDWAFSYLGIEAKEIRKYWAVWESGFNTDLISYYDFEGTTEAEKYTDKYLGRFNLTETGTVLNWTGARGDGINISTAGTYLQYTNLPDGPVGSSPFTIRMLVNPSHTTGWEGNYGRCWAYGGTTQVDQTLWIGRADNSPPDFSAGQFGYAGTTWNANNSILNNKWYQITWVHYANNTNLYYVNDTVVATDGEDYSLPSNPEFRIGMALHASETWRGYLDEYAFYNRTLSAQEISDLWNEGVPLTITDLPPASAVTVSLITPTDTQKFNNNTITFNCSATTTGGVYNLSLMYPSDKRNYTIYNTTDNQNLSLQTLITLPDGQHNYTCNSSNAGGEYSTIAYTFTIDTTDPSIYIDDIQRVGFGYSGQTINFNWTVTDDNLDSCWYDYDGVNYTVNCGDNNATITISNPTNDSIIFYANDSVNNIGFNSTVWYYDLFLNNEIFTNVVTENSQENYYINVTKNSSISSLTGSLIFDGAVYSGDSIGTDEVQFNSTVIMPSVSVQTTKNFYWNFTADSNNIISNTNTVTINQITSLEVTTTNCSNGYSPVLYYVIKDEINNSNLSSSIYYNFKYGSSNLTVKENYGSYTGTNDLLICINNTLGSINLGYGEVQYSSPGYVSRNYYEYYNTNLSNTTQYNRTLYNLLSSSSTSFKLEVETNNLIPYTNKYTRLLRWYPNFNEYKTVGMGVTDENGDTVIKVVAEDVDYRVGVYEQDGTLIKLADPSRLICLVNPCTYTLKVSPTDTDYTALLDITYSLTYNKTTGIWTFIYDDTSGLTTQMNLTVYKISPTSNNVVCNSIGTGATGAINCNTSLYTTGTLKAVVTRTASPDVILATKLVNLAGSVFRSGWGLFLLILLAIPIIFIFAYVSPILAIIGGVIAMIPAFLLGSINIGIFGGIIVLAGIILQVLKRVG